MFFLGLDGGGTKTECAIADSSRVLARSVAGSCKTKEVGEAAATRAIRQCVQDALTAAHVAADQITATCAGLAGASQPDVVSWAERSLGELVSGRINVVGDHLIAHAAAFHGQPGILVISGTGSIACGTNARGQFARAGGHGPATSDEGSARWIVRHAAASALAAGGSTETGGSTGLQAGEIGSSDLSRFSAGALLNDKNSDLAPLFPAVLAAAEQADPHAIAALTAAGRELANLVMLVNDQLQAADKPQPADTTPLTVCIAGSVLQHSRIVQDSLRAELHRRCPGAQLDTRLIDPIDGALHLARQLV